MAIKRFYAVDDATITNSYKSDLITRSTTSNTGKSDILEVYSIYGRIESESIELSRCLLRFDFKDFDESSIAGTPKYYLKLFNAEHAEALPSDYSIIIRPVLTQWDEGHGLDLVGYSDEGHASWFGRRALRISQVVNLTVDLAAVPGDYANQSISLFDYSQRFNFYFKTAAGEVSSGINTGKDVEVDISALQGDETPYSVLKSTISAHPSFTVLETQAGEVDITNVTPGVAEDPEVSALAPMLVANVVTPGADYTPWSSPGGDYTDVLNNAQVPIEYKFDFSEGNEDLEVDITEMVQSWLSDAQGSLTNYGLGVMLESQYEDGSRSTSYYTKRFFARDSQYFLKRPCIEARYDDFIGDDSSSIKTANPHWPKENNIMRVYYQNHSRGTPFDLSEAPKFTLTSDSELNDKVTLAADTDENIIASSPSSGYEENAHVEFAVNNTSAATPNGFMNSLITVSYVDSDTNQETLFHFVSRLYNWNAPANSNQVYAVNPSNTLQNRIAAAQSIVEEMNAYPGFANLFHAVSASEKVRIYSKAPGSAGRSASVSLYKLSSQGTNFLNFSATQSQAGAFAPHVPEDIENNIPEQGNEYDSESLMDQVAYDAFKAELGSYFSLAGIIGNLLLGENITYNRSTRSFRGNTGVSPTAITSDLVTGHTGLYLAEFKVASNISTKTLYKKWWIGAEDVSNILLGHGGNHPVQVKHWYEPESEYSPSDYVLSMPSIQSEYSTVDNVCFKVKVKKRNSAINVVSKNKGSVYSDFVRSLHYRLFRISDNFEIISCNTETNDTRLSYDESGNYFNLDLSILEPGYSYGIQYTIVDAGNKVQSEKVFKFRVGDK